MELFYRLQGFFAAAGNRLSRTRVNLVQLNWMMMIVLLGLSLVCADLFADSLRQGEVPVRTTVEEIHSGKVRDDSYVVVSGLAIHRGIKQTSNKNGRTISSTHYLVVVQPEPQSIPEAVDALFGDGKWKQGLLVKTRKGELVEADEDPFVELEGTLTWLDSSVRDHIAANKEDYEGWGLHPTLMLELGDKPSNAWTSGFFAILFVLLTYCAFSTWLQRYIVFRPQQPSEAATGPGATDAQLELRASGVFRHEDDTNRFTWLESALLESGGVPVVCSNVDASKRFFGVVTRKRIGTWMLVLGRGRSVLLEHGSQYYGFSRKPALRVRVESSGRTTTAVLAFETEAGRAAAAALFQGPQPTGLPT